MRVNIVKTQDSITPAIIGMAKALGIQGRRRVLKYTADEFVRQTHTNFGGGSGSKYKEHIWPALSKAYAKKVGRTYATLKVSGDLFNSIKANTPRNNWVEVYTTNKYAAAHMLGYEPRKLPKRNYFPIQFYTPTYSRLLWNSERDLLFQVSKWFTIMSDSHLPRLPYSVVRSLPAYGNPFSPPQGGN